MLEERLLSKIKLNPLNDKFKVEFGTYNRKNPKVVFLNIKTWVKSKNSDYLECVAKMNRTLKYNIRECIINNKSFKDNIIINIDIATKQMKEGKNSFLDIEIFLTQKSTLPIKAKKLVAEAESIMNKFIESFDEFTECFEFSTKKNIS